MECTKPEFVQQILAAQAALRLYLRAVVMDRDVGEELLQRTNVVLCEKAEEFLAGTNFLAWARRVAHFEVLGYRRRLARERQKLVFDDDQLEEIGLLVEESWSMDDERRALRECLSRLPEKSRQLLRRRYENGQDVSEIATQLCRPCGSIRQTLFRIRLVLLSCMQANLHLSDGGGYE